MQIRKNSGVTLALVLLIANTSSAASTETNVPSAKEVISRHIEAVGGAVALLHQQSYRLSGAFDLPAQNASGTLEIFAKQPHKLWLKVIIPKTGKYLRATDGQTMWHFNPQSGYRTREDWEYQTKQGLKCHDDEPQQRLTEMLDIFSALRDDGSGAVARTIFHGRPSFELQFVCRKSQSVKEFFDTGSGLRIGAIYAGTNAETFLIDGYKEFNGIKIATRVTRLANGKTNDVFTIASAEFVDVPDSKFAMPIHIPEWPEGWNQIDEAYPPGFAKATIPWPWKGEHSRWFSPGFGRTNDAFFWSYAVFNALEGDTLNSPAELQDALHRYDASLYGKAFSPEKIKVTVGDARTENKLGHELTRRSAVIDGFDAESSKKELRTYLETFRWYCPTVNRTAFLVLRSPRPFQSQDEVWKVLQRFRDELVCHDAVPVKSASLQTD